MLAAWALILGGIVRICGETAEILAGGHTGLSGGLAGFALVLAAFGFTGLWQDAKGGLWGRGAIVLIAAGALGFTAIAAWSVSQGTLPVGSVARLPVFAIAAATTFGGAVLLLIWLVSSGIYPRWIGVVMSLAVGLSLVSSFVAFPPLVQPLIDMVMALTFIQLGLSMRERRLRDTATS